VAVGHASVRKNNECCSGVVYGIFNDSWGRGRDVIIVKITLYYLNDNSGGGGGNLQRHE